MQFFKAIYLIGISVGITICWFVFSNAGEMGFSIFLLFICFAFTLAIDVYLFIKSEIKG